jgi:NhaC family Na+:H+ antiporter
MEKPTKQMALGWALIPLIFLIIALVTTMRVFKGDPHLPILATAIVAAIIGAINGSTWSKMEAGIANTIRVASPAILILLIIGMIIGTWILAGIVPALIYYGLQILSPGFFLVTAAIICCIVSLATGSSWTTAGTVGIALIGIGQGFGIPLPMVAGAIVSGAYFGDKMSPLSDTTNLAPAMAGATLFDHIRHMVYTTTPSLLIALALYYFIGRNYASNDLDYSQIELMLHSLASQFRINLWLLLPPLLVIVIVVARVPAIPGLTVGVVIGAIWAGLFQKAGMTAIIRAAHYGFVSETGVKAVDALLTRGGLDSMMWTISLILCAMTLAGVLESTGILNSLATAIVKLARNTGSLVLATVCACIGTNLVAGDQYLSIVVPGRLFKPLYAQRRLKPKNLSRVLEDAGTLSSPLVPWNTCGAFMYTTLGVYPFVYLPFAFLNLINPLVSIFYGFTGLTMEKFSDDEDSGTKEA